MLCISTRFFLATTLELTFECKPHFLNLKTFLVWMLQEWMWHFSERENSF